MIFEESVTTLIGTARYADLLLAPKEGQSFWPFGQIKTLSMLIFLRTSFVFNIILVSQEKRYNIIKKLEKKTKQKNMKKSPKSPKNNY